MHTFDNLRRFGGIARLYGQAGLDKLTQAHVCVVGVGGVGSWAVEALARSGIGELTLIDLDNIAVSNFSGSFDFVIDAIDQTRIKLAMIKHFIKTKQPFIISGSAGGQRNPALIETADLSQTTQDPMLSNLRYTLRKKHGFVREGKMCIPCVYSREQITPPQITESCEISGSQNAPQGLSCAGYGASMVVTATFGLYCATAAIEHIVKR